MAKKNFPNLGSNENLSRGVDSLVTNTFQESKKEVTKTEEIKIFSNKTFVVLDRDHEYLKKFVRIRAVETDSDFSQKDALIEAINLLREKYPHIT
jgi:hypothetical protein